MADENYWYDYAKGDFEYCKGPSDGDVERFLPQTPAAMSLYTRYRQMGNDMLTAVASVLKKFIPKEQSECKS